MAWVTESKRATAATSFAVDNDLFVGGDVNFDANAIVNGTCDVSGDLTVGGVIYSSGSDVNAASITAHAGGGISEATAITKPYVVIATCATHLDSVQLPTGYGDVIIVKNAGAKDAAVYPPVNHAIDSIATNGYYALASGSVQEFVRFGAAQWYTKNSVERTVPLSTYVALIDQTGANMNNAYQSLDVSAHVPPSGYGKMASFQVAITDNNASAYCRIASFATTPAGAYIGADIRPLVASIERVSTYSIPVNSDGTIVYLASEALAGFRVVILSYTVCG